MTAAAGMAVGHSQSSRCQSRTSRPCRHRRCIVSPVLHHRIPRRPCAGSHHWNKVRLDARRSRYSRIHSRTMHTGRQLLRHRNRRRCHAGKCLYNSSGAGMDAETGSRVAPEEQAVSRAAEARAEMREVAGRVAGRATERPAERARVAAGPMVAAARAAARAARAAAASEGTLTGRPRHLSWCRSSQALPAPACRCPGNPASRIRRPS